MEQETYRFYKSKPTDIVWKAERNKGELFGEFLFSFDKKKVYDLFRDFPEKLSKEQIELFCAENPFWKDFFGIK